MTTPLLPEPMDDGTLYVFPDGSTIYRAYGTGRWRADWVGGGNVRQANGSVSYFETPEQAANILAAGDEGPISLAIANQNREEREYAVRRDARADAEEAIIVVLQELEGRSGFGDVLGGLDMDTAAELVTALEKRVAEALTTARLRRLEEKADG